MIEELQNKGLLDLDENELTSTSHIRKPKAHFIRTLTYWQLVMLGFGNTIGAGIFTLTGIAA